MITQAYSEKKNLVFVDDDDITNKLVRRLARDSNHSVHTFTDTDEAQAFINANEIHLLIVDLRMPIIDGIEFLEKLDLPSRTSRIHRVIIQTGAEPESAVRNKVESLGHELIIKDELLDNREAFLALIG